MKKTVLALTVAVAFMFVASVSSAAVTSWQQVKVRAHVKRLVGLPQTKMSRKTRSWYSMLARLVTAGVKTLPVH